MSAFKILKCGVCSKTVYPNDKQLKIDGCAWHHLCAVCNDCKKPLTLHNFAKSSDFLDEQFLLCQTHYNERFIHMTGNSLKYKGGWQRSVEADGQHVLINKKEWKENATSPYAHEETSEIAENVFLVSKFSTKDDEFLFHIENKRSTPVYVDIDFSNSVNLQNKESGKSLLVDIVADGGKDSTGLSLVKSKANEEHHIALNAVVLDTPFKEKRVNIADQVYLVSTFNVISKETVFHVENNRDQHIEVSLDFTCSQNLALKGSELMSIILSAEKGKVSNDAILTPLNPAENHEVSVKVDILAKAIAEKAPDIITSQDISLPDVSTLNLKSSTPIATPIKATKVSGGLRDRVNVFSSSGSAYIPMPGKEKAAKNVEVQFFGPQRITQMKKSEN